MSENLVPYVTAAGAGDTEAMGKLYAKTLKGSYYLATKLCGAGEAPAEIVKQAYAKAFCNLDRLKRPEAFEIWMKQNVAGAYRDSQLFSFSDADGAAQPVNNEFLDTAVLEDAAQGAAVLQAVAALKPELRTALVLHYNNGMPVQALAKFLGVSESTVNAMLSKACAQVLAESGAAASVLEPAGGLPVLTRLFQQECDATTVVTSDVRDIFIYAQEAFMKYQAAKAAQNAAPVNAADPNSAQYFKQKIHESLDPNAAAAQPPLRIPERPQTPETAVPAQEAPAEPSAANFHVPSEPTEFPEPEQYEEMPAPRDKHGNGLNALKARIPKNVNWKRLGIALAAILLLILLIAGIAKAVKNGRSKTPTDTAATTNAGQAVVDGAVSWVPGGFADCTDIQYLDETYAKFKSAATGKWGLMDYQGNVIMQPIYEDFIRCSYGREYKDGRNSYHSLVVISGEKYEFTVENGKVTVSSAPHAAHSVEADALEDGAYDERDRYFEGYAAARKDGKWGYVNEKGKKVIPYEYDAVNDLASHESASCDYCRPVSGGLVPVKKNGMMGIVDLKNNTVANFEYSNIMPGKDGVFIACKAGTWGVILTGNAVNTFPGVNMQIESNTGNVTDPTGETGLKYVVNSDDGANVRSGAGADFNRLGTLDDGDEVLVLGFETADNGKEWAKITFEGETGYVSMLNLDRVEESESSEN